ncbi:ATP synthase F0 subunit C [Desulfonema ishimotonii]|uniref:ATP synthase subunit c n=1 Tax=Desulfonema ishimotonii TaxID=45657 RepID=A0A401G1R0_9BACT|nr:ATP synthase F0 subunit C [Desulfonema ishimotonii]GBC63178.1 ATP synthase F0 subunit C [Desulfonema ishimotonii]
MGYDIETWVKVSAFVGSGVAMGFGAIGAAIGEGYTAAEANAAISRNPDSAGNIFKSMLVGQAVAESAAIFALVIAMMLLFTKHATSPIMIFIQISAGLCMGIGAIGSGIGSGYPAGETCKGIARQPGMADRLTTTMLIGSAICQTSAIYALVTSLILLYSDFASRPFSPTWAAVLGAGFAAGIGAIGSGIGEGLVAKSGCEGVARQPLNSAPTTNGMLLGMAVAETTAIYGLLISVILMFKAFEPTASFATAMALIASGLCMGLGAIGPGIGEGFTGSGAVRWMARSPEDVGILTRSMLVGQAVAESTGIYSLVIALVLIFVI